MVAHGRVTNHSLKGLLAASCIFSLDLIISICHDVYVD